MATLTQDVTLKHRANLGDPVGQITLSAGASITILSEWSEHYLARDSQGRIFNICKQVVAR